MGSYHRDLVLMNSCEIENRKMSVFMRPDGCQSQPGISCQQTTERGGTGFSIEARGLAGHHSPGEAGSTHCIAS